MREIELKRSKKKLVIDELTGRQVLLIKNFRSRFDVSIFKADGLSAVAADDIEAFIDKNFDALTELLAVLFGETKDFYLDLPVSELVLIVTGLIEENYEALKNLRGSLTGFQGIVIQGIKAVGELIKNQREAIEKEVEKATKAVSISSAS